MNHTCLCLPRVGTHLPTPKGWKAELALGGLLVTEINVRHRELNPDMVAHLSTNRARRMLTYSLVEANALRQTTSYSYITSSITEKVNTRNK